MAAVPDRPPPRADPRGRRDGGGARHGVRRTRPDVAHAPLRGDPARPRDADRPRGLSAGSAGHRPGPRGDARRGSLRPRLPVRLRNGAGGRVCPPPASRGGSRRRRNGRGADGLFDARGVVCNLPALSKAAGSSGFFNVTPDPDGVLRRVPLVIRHKGALYPNLALALYLRARGGDAVLETGPDGIEALRLDGRRIPLDRHGNLLVNFRGPHRTFPHLSAAAVLDRDRGPGAVEGKDRPARDHRRRAQGDPHHAARRRPARSGNPRQRPRQPAFGRPDRGAAMGAGGERPPRPVPRVPADRPPGAVQRRRGGSR